MTKDQIIILVVLGAIALILLIIALLYIIIAFRKINIVFKKTDYLVEDLTYKSEILMPAVETMTKITKYSEILDEYIANNSKFIYDFLKRNKLKIDEQQTKAKAEETTETKPKKSIKK